MSLIAKFCNNTEKQNKFQINKMKRVQNVLKHKKMKNFENKTQ